MLSFAQGQGRSIEELLAIDVPARPPWPGASRWTPINHGVLATTVVRVAEERGLRTRSHRWAVNGSETDLFGALVFDPSPRLRLARGLCPALALRHGNAGRYAVTLGFGAQVFVCSNGLLSVDHPLKRKHTDGLDLDAMIGEGVDAFLASARTIDAFARRLQDTPLTRATADRVLVEAGRRRVLPWSALGRVESEWREPRHRAFRRRDAWSLYNAFTSAAKDRRAAGQLATLRRLSRLFEARTLRRLAA